MFGPPRAASHSFAAHGAIDCTPSSAAFWKTRRPNSSRRAASTASGYAIVALLFAVSLCFLTFAGYRALELAMGSIQASLIVGCAYLFLALVAALVLQVRRR